MISESGGIGMRQSFARREDSRRLCADGPERN